MITAEMRDSEIAEVSEFLCSSYAALGQTEGLSGDRIHLLRSGRGSEACVRRESRRQVYLVAHESDAIIGMVAVDGETIEKLYASPEHLGRGVGRSLYEAGESLVREWGHAGSSSC